MEKGAKTSRSTTRTKKTIRYNQLAATTGNNIHEFRGFVDLPLRDKIRYGPKTELISPRKQSRPQTARYSARSTQNDTECEEALKKVSNPNEINEISDETLAKLPKYIRLKSHLYANKGDYRSVENIRKKLFIVDDEISRRKVPKEVPVSYADYEKAKEEHDKKWEQIFQNFDTETEQKYTDLFDKHDKQIEDFETEWSTNQIEKFRKPSGTLIRQRRIEKQLIRRDLIDQAAWVHQTVKELEIKEADNAQRNFNHAYIDAANALKAKQDAEISKFIDIRTNQRDLLLKDRAKEATTLERRYHVLNSKQSKSIIECSPCLRNIPARIRETEEEDDDDCVAKLPQLTMPRSVLSRPSTAASTSRSHTKRREDSASMSSSPNTEKQNNEERPSEEPTNFINKVEPQNETEKTPAEVMKNLLAAGPVDESIDPEPASEEPESDAK